MSSGGAANYSIPIVVPPGTAGVAPKLAFTYNSQGENSLLGVGWSVSGLPVIHRCGATLAQDGFKGGVNYDINDRFCLDGARLMVISGSYGGNGAEYRTEVDSFVKVKSFGVAGSGPAYFKVWTKSGEVMEFGNTANSAIEAQGKTSVRVWALNKVQDTKGNYLTVTYSENNANGEYRPTQIQYTGNTAGGLSTGRKVEFLYQTRPDIVPLYVGGSLIQTTVRLTNVKTYLTLPSAVLVRDYQLQYETGTASKRSRLTKITECTSSCAAPNGLPPNIFTWQEGGNGSYNKVKITTYASDEFNSTSARAGDVNGDGKMDIITAEQNPIDLSNWIISYLSNGDGSYTKVKVTNYASGEFKFTTMRMADVNGDGKADIVTGDNNWLISYVSNGDGSYTKVKLTSYAANEFNVNNVWAGDYNGDGREDILSAENNFFTSFL